MKKLIGLFVIVFALHVFGQTWLKIHKTNGVTDSVKLSDIVQIYFTNSPASIVCGTSTVDYYGTRYHTVQIGNQCWLKENLNIGAMLPVSSDQANNILIEKYCYQDDTLNCTVYGGLYQWGEALQYTNSAKPQGICPIGWHIPAIEEFQVLSAAVAGDGHALKAVGQGQGTNTSNFSGLLSGIRSTGVYYDYIHQAAKFWSSTEQTSENGQLMQLYWDIANIEVIAEGKTEGCSIRCIKD